MTHDPLALTLLVETAKAYGYDPLSEARAENQPFDFCACSHHKGAHDGEDGRGRCTETRCGCPGFVDADLECPNCLAIWPNGRHACPNCGLTIEAVAESLALVKVSAIGYRIALRLREMT